MRAMAVFSRVRITILATLVAVPAALLVAAPADAATTGSAAPRSVCSTRFLPLPDPSCTPGVLNPNVTQATINSTICVRGWTSTIRPPVSYTDRLKVQQIAEYGYANTNPADYEEDHFIPLSIGGHPRDPRNLWPQPRYGSPNAADKDNVEFKVYRAVCDGRVTLAAARNAMSTNWTTALSRLGIG